VVATLEYGPSAGRLALAGMPLYLLPHEDGVQLGTNLLLWLTGGE
jgi:hypothetical protein